MAATTVEHIWGLRSHCSQEMKIKLVHQHSGQGLSYRWSGLFREEPLNYTRCVEQEVL